MKWWAGAVVAMIVVGGAAVFAATVAKDDPQAPPARWVARAGYSLVDYVAIGDGSQIRLWVNTAAPEVRSLVEDASAAGEHRAVELTVQAWRTNRGDLAAPQELSLSA